MAKEIKFNIKLLIDGKEQLVTASTSAKELRDNPFFGLPFCRYVSVLSHTSNPLVYSTKIQKY